MRRFTLLVLSILVGTSVWAQELYQVKPGEQPSKHISSRIDSRSGLETSVVAGNPGLSSRIPMGTTRNGAVTSVKIGEATNGFNSLLQSVNQLSVVNQYNSIYAIHRSNTANCGGNSGDYRFAYSTDGGVTWQTNSAGGCFGYGPLNTNNATQAGRYPSVFAYNPPSSTAFADVDLVYTGRISGANGWEGNVAGVVNDPSNFTNQATNVTQEFYPMATSLEDGTYTSAERVPGEYFIPSRVNDGPEEGTIVVRKGVLNSTTNQISWSIVDSVRNPLPYLFEGWFINQAMAFSPDGQHGYIATVGDMDNGVEARDSTLGILVSESHDGGNTWSDFDEIDLSIFDSFRDSMSSFWVFNDTVNNVVVPAGSGKAICWGQLDMTVDKNGDPHIITWFGNNSFWSPDDSAYNFPGYTIFFGLRKFVVDLTRDNTGNWNGIFINDLNTFDGDFGGLTGIESYTQVSRSENGRYIFFSYTDTDTTGNFQSNDNTAPNMITMGYDVDTRMATTLNNRTINDLNWDGLALLATVAPTALEGAGSTYIMPTMISDFVTGDGTGETNFWYFTDVAFDTATEFTENAVFFNNCFDFGVAFTSVDPTCGVSNGELTANVTGGVGPYSYSWTGSGAAGNITGTVSGLAPGEYGVTVSDDQGCETELTFVLESDGAATLAASTLTDISCNGFDDGNAIVVPTGGTAPFTYMWSNGEMNDTAFSLPAGLNTVQVTDDNDCVSFAEVTIVEPDSIDVLTILDGSTTCFGDTDGSVFVEAVGGTGNLTYMWDGGTMGQTLADLDSGSYSVTITDDNGCTTTATATVSYPDPIVVTASELLPDDDPNLPNNGAINVNFDQPGNGPGYTIVARLIEALGQTQDTVLQTKTSNNTSDEQLLLLCGGVYEITVTDVSRCVGIDTTEITGNACSFVVNNIRNAGLESIQVFPNPTEGELEVELVLTNASEVSLELINAQGKLIERRDAGRVGELFTRFDLSNQASGIYLLRVSTPLGVETRQVMLR